MENYKKNATHEKTEALKRYHRQYSKKQNAKLKDRSLKHAFIINV